MTARPSQPELVVVEDDRIVAVGERGLLDQFPDTVTEDLRGATLCPGFIDAHHHLSIAALHPQWADASRSTSPADLAEVLLAQAAREPRTPWCAPRDGATSVRDTFPTAVSWTSWKWAARCWSRTTASTKR